MAHKWVAGVFIALAVGALVFGAVSLAKGPDEARAARGRGEVAYTETLQRQQGGGWGTRGAGRGQNAETVQRGTGLAQNGGTGIPQADVQPEAWYTVEGVVIDADELVIALNDGSTLAVGLGPSHYRDGQGFVIEVGQHLAISGFDEDGEFKAGTVENLDTGARIVLRDASGRPMWAGQGRNRA